MVCFSWDLLISLMKPPIGIKKKEFVCLDFLQFTNKTKQEKNCQSLTWSELTNRRAGSFPEADAPIVFSLNFYWQPVCWLARHIRNLARQLVCFY